MKKRLLTTSIAVLLILSQALSLADSATIRYNEKNSTVNVRLQAQDYTQYKVLVQKSKQKYFYNVYDNDETFPLQMGSGAYRVVIYKRISGKKYRPIKNLGTILHLGENDVYLQSVQNIDWKKTSKAVKIAKELALDKAQTEEQFKTIYEKVVRTVVYDNLKARIASKNHRYLPNIDETLLEGKGICYDYSSLIASMLRSLGIPTKMVHGRSKNTGKTYHAWNEVLLNGKWIVVDSTIDAGLYRRHRKYNFEKPNKDYKGSKNF